MPVASDLLTQQTPNIPLSLPPVHLRAMNGYGNGRPTAIRARGKEIEILAQLFGGASAGRGGALVVHGEAGIGKTAVVEHALAHTPRLQVLRAAGAEFEMELPYAALHQLCAPVLESRTQLPAPQRAALESVFGLRDEGVPDAFLVGLAVLGLLAEVSRTRALVCVVDDAQWVDSASRQALAFAARRVEAERVAFVFALRDPEASHELAGLARLRIEGLADADARELLAAEVHVRLDGDVRDRIVAEAQGNPLALLELPRGVGPLELAGGFGGMAARPVAGVVEENFARRLAGLSADAQALLVLAAAEPLGDGALLRRAASALGVGAEAAQVAEAAGLLTLGPRVRFRHPLVRSAAYRTATPAGRRKVHAALAAATDAARDPDRRAWHRAQAAIEPDEDTAAELERAAGRAQARGGLAAASALLERAADLTPDPARRVGRILAAARTTLRAGAPGAALELLEQTEASPVEDHERGHARLLRAMIAFQVSRDGIATSLLLDAAEMVEPDLARETYLEAFASAMVIDHLHGRLVELAERVKTRAPRREPPRPVDLVLDALTDQMTLPSSAAVPAMRRAVAAYRDEAASINGDPRWMELACHLASDLFDAEALRVLADGQVELSRRQGALAVLPMALNYQSLARVIEGEFSAAAAGIAEAHAVGAATGSVGLVFGDVILAAWRGDEARVEALFAMMHERAGRQEVVAELYARAVLHNGLGNYEAALDAALRAHEQERLGSYALWQLAPELVEAAARLGRPDAAAPALRQFVERARASGTEWALGLERRSRALLAQGSDAGPLYREAIERLERAGVPAQLARARLVHGEWLRRERRRVEAREELRKAYDVLSRMGAAGYAARAARELQATGEHPRQRGVDRLDALTPQELHIARHVASGATSKEIAGELFLSPRTIDAHLRNIFRKLDISSRRQLRDLQI